MSYEVNITDAWLRKLKPPVEREDFRDRGTRGLQLRSSPSGVKTFSFVFRLGSKMGRATLGRYPDVDLKFARTKADEFRKLVSQGIDPRSEKRAKRRLQEMTVELMVHEFIQTYAKPKNSSWKQAESNLRLYLSNFYGTQPISEVTRADIHQILDDLIARDKQTAANRALAHIRKFFGWLVERGYLNHSPADHIKPRHKESERHRVLSDAEIKAIWDAAKSMSGPYSAWLKLLLLCGQRRVETASMRRSQIIDGSWHLSATDTKNKQPHIIPLPNQAQRLVDQLIEKEGNFLIKSGRNGDRPVNGFSKAKLQMDRLSGVENWKFHDLRRTVATNLTKLGIDRLILQKIINHSERGVTQIYDRYSYMDEKREALQKWADRLDDIVK
ncbi:tyrosine-type recombinase/integrase [bacterium]|jgi:integrase|nr:tyrosine-type recombinase/integrase [bacterium]